MMEARTLAIKAAFAYRKRVVELKADIEFLKLEEAHSDEGDFWNLESEMDHWNQMPEPFQESWVTAIVAVLMALKQSEGNVTADDILRGIAQGIQPGLTVTDMVMAMRDKDPKAFKALMDKVGHEQILKDRDELLEEGVIKPQPRVPLSWVKKAAERLAVRVKNELDVYPEDLVLSDEETVPIQELEDLIKSSVLAYFPPKDGEDKPLHWHLMEEAKRDAEDAAAVDIRPGDMHVVDFIVSDVEAIRAERQAVYGDFIPGHTALGRRWAADLSLNLGTEIPDLPADLVLLMLADLKMNRLMIPTGRQHHDNYLDLRAYAQMGEEAAERLQ